MPKSEYYFPKRELVSQAHAQLVEPPRVPRAKFQTTWNRLMTFDAGYITPFMVDAVLPGDHLSYDITTYVRLQTPLFPIFSQQNLETFGFFTPSRIVWDAGPSNGSWTQFMGEQANPTDSIAYTIPTFTLAPGDIAPNTIYDHMLACGNQVAAGHTLTVNALPFRMGNLIFNTWFRDQNLQNSQTVRMTNTGDLKTDFTLLRIARYHDYFTSMLPWPQKFTPPSVPLTGFAPVSGIGLAQPGDATVNPATFYELEHPAGVTYAHWAGLEVSNTNVAQAYPTTITQRIGMHVDNVLYVPTAAADLANTGGLLTPGPNFTINAFRQSFMIQTLLERDARGGTRYIELLKSHWGVVSPDFRLQRPEYIGGGNTPLMVTPVAQTAPTTGATVGALGAAATSTGRHHFSYAATEHGYIIGFIAVRTELAWQQGLNRMWTVSTRYDFPWPALSELGEQPVLTQELYATGDPANDQVVLGYQERWHEWRTRTSEVTGYFNSTQSTPLDAWHLAPKFTSAPTLSAALIQDAPPVSRVLAAGTAANNQQYLADILIKRTATRNLPAYGTPAVLGRF